MAARTLIGATLTLLMSLSLGVADAGVLGPTKPSDLQAGVVFFTSNPACSGATGADELAGTPMPPLGKVFILTSYQWALDTTGYPTNFPIQVGLASVTDSSGINAGNIVSFSTAPNSGTGAVVGNQSIPNGVVAIRPSTGQMRLCIFPETGGTRLTGEGWVQGYFAADR